VDVKTEAEIMRATEKLMQGRTTFMIAHRLTTIANCDLVLVLDNGRLMGVRKALEPGLKKALEDGAISFVGESQTEDVLVQGARAAG
jgi:ABC-type multidrug transport system ATPase subunit